MHIAYSALQHQSGFDTGSKTSVKNSRQLRYKGYRAACQKYQQEILAIQQYLPGWKPSFK
jgi:hypothetical protein